MMEIPYNLRKERRKRKMVEIMQNQNINTCKICGWTYERDTYCCSTSCQDVFIKNLLKSPEDKIREFGEFITNNPESTLSSIGLEFEKLFGYDPTKCRN